MGTNDGHCRMRKAPPSSGRTQSAACSGRIGSSTCAVRGRGRGLGHMIASEIEVPNMSINLA
jgi:hypothetical protein